MIDIQEYCRYHNIKCKYYGYNTPRTSSQLDKGYCHKNKPKINNVSVKNPLEVKSPKWCPIKSLEKIL